MIDLLKDAGFRKLHCWFAIVGYPACVAFLTGMKLTMPLLLERMPWAEVFYGPAVLVACAVSIWIFGQGLIERMKRRKSTDPSA